MVDCRVWGFESGTITGCFAKLERAMVWIYDEGCGSVWKCKDSDFANSEGFFLGGVAWKVPVFFLLCDDWWMRGIVNAQTFIIHELVHFWQNLGKYLAIARCSCKRAGKHAN